MVKVHLNLSYNTYLLVGHFWSICYTAKRNRSRLILWSKLKIHSPSRAARKSLQTPCPLSEALLPFSSTSLRHPCPSVHLPSTHKCHLNSPALVAQQNAHILLSLILSYFVSQCTSIKTWSLPQAARDSSQSLWSRAIPWAHAAFHAGMSFRFPAQQQKLGQGMLHLTFLGWPWLLKAHF